MTECCHYDEGYDDGYEAAQLAGEDKVIPALEAAASHFAALGEYELVLSIHRVTDLIAQRGVDGLVEDDEKRAARVLALYKEAVAA